MTANLDNIHEIYNIFIQKNRMHADIITLFRRFQLSRTLSRLKMEKQQGVSASLLIVLLCLFRMCHESIGSFYSHKFHGLFESGKNCFYRMYNRSSMNWRKLLLRMSVRFMGIVRKEDAEEKDHAHCFIIDDTALEKTGSCIEGISRVFDHVTHGFVLGYKLLLLAYFDGRSSIPVDFSLHREKGKEKKYGLTAEERSAQYHKERNADDAGAERVMELDSDKLSCAIGMLRRAWKAGLKATYVLCDSWFTEERLISEVKKLSGGCMSVIGMAKMGKRRYRVEGSLLTAHELVARYERSRGRKDYKHKTYMKYIRLNGMMGDEYVRIFLIKYGSNQNWNVIISSDPFISFEKCFETYQVRWNIEVMNKECKQYLELGKYQGRDFDGQIADCTLCFITYTLLALDKRFSEYETMGELFGQHRSDLMALTLWQRILGMIEAILETLADIMSIDLEELAEKILNDEKAAKKYAVMLDALRKYDKAA